MSHVVTQAELDRAAARRLEILLSRIDGRLEVLEQKSDETNSATSRIEARLAQILSKEASIMTNLDGLTTKVEATLGAEQSAVVAINGLAQEVRDLKASTTDPATQAAIDALAQKLDDSAQALAAAVAANPVDPPPAAPTA
jgi:hypothetical protein